MMRVGDSAYGGTCGPRNATQRIQQNGLEVHEILRTENQYLAQQQLFRTGKKTVLVVTSANWQGPEK